MPNYTTEDIRNIALVGHGGAGKTMLAEAMLLKAGAIASLGEITRGTTVSDFDPLEKEHQHSLNASVMNLEYGGVHVNLIDTPGYPDFLGRALSVLPAVETVAVVIDARSGIEMNTRRMMQTASERGLCRMIVVNKVDADDANLESLLHQITDAFGSECLPINLPSKDRKKVIDCFFNPEGNDVAFSSVSEAHTQIVDQVVEVDEKLMELYLEQGEDLEPEKLHDAFEEALRDGHLVPVCFTAAESGVGVGELLNVIAKLMPNPKEGNPPPFFKGTGEKAEAVTVSCDPAKHALAHVFKVTVDAFVGRLGVFRIHQGSINKDSQLFIGSARKPFKVGHLFNLQGKDHVEIDSGIPGDICAVAKVEEVVFDSVLHDSHDEDEFRMQPVAVPAPMFGLAIQSKARGDEQKLSDALQKLSAEDPCFRVEHNAVLNETVIRGLGDLHLRVILEKMKERYNVEVSTSTPKIAYRETITKPADGHHRHKKQTGGAGQFGEVYLKVEPMNRGGGFEFVNKIVGGVIPQQFIPAIEKGVRQVLEQGAIAGYGMEDVRVTVYDGKYHTVDSKEVAFVAAGKKAFLDAINKANPIVLEPIVNISVTVPQGNMGDVTGDLSAKRGRINGTNALAGGMVTVTGQVPLSELSTYQSELKSVTGGVGSYSMELSHYDPVPAQIQQQLRSEFKPRAEEE
ncbi:MAG: elongation factor G [Gammaproteobacteria bacterium]|nr:elongation factor G [Gammaproteobacteria bacterium]MDH3411260.1 elongation factor G [Gammaproteobacteria bacterium]